MLAGTGGGTAFVAFIIDELIKYVGTEYWLRYVRTKLHVQYYLQDNPYNDIVVFKILSYSLKMFFILI